MARHSEIPWASGNGIRSQGQADQYGTRTEQRKSYQLSPPPPPPTDDPLLELSLDEPKLESPEEISLPDPKELEEWDERRCRSSSSSSWMLPNPMRCDRLRCHEDLDQESSSSDRFQLFPYPLGVTPKTRRTKAISPKTARIGKKATSRKDGPDRRGSIGVG